MDDIYNQIVIDVPDHADGKDQEFFVFTEGVRLAALGFIRGLGTIRLILSHPELRMPTSRLLDAIPLARARIKYPFLFLMAEETNPLLYREF